MQYSWTIFVLLSHFHDVYDNLEARQFLSIGRLLEFNYYTHYILGSHERAFATRTIHPKLIIFNLATDFMLST